MLRLTSTRRFLSTGRTLLVASALSLGAPVFTGHAGTLAAATQAQAKNEALVRAAFDRWVAGTGNIFAELLSPDVVWTIHGSGPIAGTYRGREDFIERASMPLISRLATPLVPRVHHIWSADDTVIMRFDGSAKTNSGETYENQFVWIFRLREGRVHEAEAFLDLTAYQRVLDTNEPRAR